MKTMVDLVYGRGITDLVREFPLYMTFFHNIIDIKLFHKKRTLYGSADITMYAISIVHIAIGGSTGKTKTKNSALKIGER